MRGYREVARKGCSNISDTCYQLMTRAVLQEIRHSSAVSASMSNRSLWVAMSVAMLYKIQFLHFRKILKELALCSGLEAHTGAQIVACKSSVAPKCRRCSK